MTDIAMHGVSSAAIVLDVPEPVATQVRLIQFEYGYGQDSPLPVHITLAGSNGLGEVALEDDIGAVLSAIDAVAHATAPISTSFGPAMRFPGTDTFVLTLLDEEPVTRLHRAIAASGLRFGPCPFPFKPHCTLTSGRPMTDAEAAELLASHLGGTFVLDSLSVYTLTPAAELLHRVSLR